MDQFLISLFGIAIIQRNLSLLEKFEVISTQKSQKFFILLQAPVYLLIFFKEQTILVTTYIGIFLITLIFYSKILAFFAENTFEKAHIRLIDHLILLLRSGKSAQTCFKLAFQNFSGWEVVVFKPLQSTFEIKTHEISLNSRISKNKQLYFLEMQRILRSNTNVVEQLKSFREGLRIQFNLRHKSRQVLSQIRAQAVVAVLIYVIIFVLCLNYFNLSQMPGLCILSFSMFLVGQTCIFMIGGKIKWKT